MFSGFTAGYLIALAMGTPVGAALVINGEFDDSGGSFRGSLPGPNGAIDQNSMPISPAAPTTIPGWKIVGSTHVTWLRDGNLFGLSAPPGLGDPYFVNLAGFQQAQPSGGLITSILTVPGVTYQVSFYIGSDSRYGSVAPGIAVRVGGGAGDTSATEFRGTLNGNNRWTQVRFEFTAGAGPATTLSFQARNDTSLFAYGPSPLSPFNKLSRIGDTAGGGTQYVGFDALEVTPVPEPSTRIIGAVALGLVLGALGMHFRNSGPQKLR